MKSCIYHNAWITYIKRVKTFITLFFKYRDVESLPYNPYFIFILPLQSDSVRNSELVETAVTLKSI